jgi:predicted  nucleic acid-binding Zn-ribbon protein
MWIRRKTFEEQQMLLQKAWAEVKFQTKAYTLLEKKFEAQKETILTLNGRCEVWAEKYNALGQELVEAQKTIKSLQKKLTSTINKNKELVELEKDLRKSVEKIKRMENEHPSKPRQAELFKKG